MTPMGSKENDFSLRDWFAVASKGYACTVIGRTHSHLSLPSIRRGCWNLKVYKQKPYIIKPTTDIMVDCKRGLDKIRLFKWLITNIEPKETSAYGTYYNQSSSRVNKNEKSRWGAIFKHFLIQFLSIEYSQITIPCDRKKSPSHFQKIKKKRT